MIAQIFQNQEYYINLYDLLKNIENAGTLDFSESKFLEIEKQLDEKYQNGEIDMNEINKYQ